MLCLSFYTQNQLISGLYEANYSDITTFRPQNVDRTLWMLLPDLRILRPSSIFPSYHLGVGDLVVRFKALKLKNIIVRMTTQR